MKKIIKQFVFISLLSVLSLFSFAAGNNQPPGINIKDFGATGDGKTPDTKAINDAIESAAAKGGGTVFFPAGVYLSYSIHLKSNIALYLDEGCVLLAAGTEANGKYDDAEPNPNDKFQDYGHSHWHNSLIWGENLENISILGTGIINGIGLKRFTSEKNSWGNKSIALRLCRNVHLKDFTVLNGGHFAILATGVDNLSISNLRMDTNRDGMDIDCCNNVRISDCSINSPYDDAICLKSSYALGYPKPTQNVTISNCGVSGYDLGTYYNGTYGRKEWDKVPDHEGPTGRIKFGTESNGGYKNITITNCVFEYCRGLALETVDGALIEDVTISNITMRDVTNSPIYLRLGARMRGPQGTPPGALRRVMISNIMVYNADSHFSSLISGIPGHDIEAIQLNNIRIYYRQMDSSFASIPQIVPENETQYPEPQKMGIMPAYGFFIRHVKDIKMNNVEVSYLQKEVRPAFMLEDVKGAFLSQIKAQPVPGTKTFVLKNTADFMLRESADIEIKNYKASVSISF